MTALAVAGSIVGLLVGILAFVKGVIPAWRSLRSVGRRLGGALDNIGGRGPFIDPTTGEHHEEIPPIGARFAGIEQKLDALADTSNRLDTIDARVAAHELRLDDHDVSIGLLGGGQFERGATAQLAAAEKERGDVIDVEGEEKP